MTQGAVKTRCKTFAGGERQEAGDPQRGAGDFSAVWYSRHAPGAGGGAVRRIQNQSALLLPVERGALWR